MRKFPVLLSVAFLAAVVFFTCKPEPKEEANWKHKDNTVRVRQAVSLKTLNPYLHRYGNETVGFELIFQYLMGFHPSTMEAMPQLTKALPTVNKLDEGEFAGGQSFDFEIHETAVWEDGKPVTGHDYEFTLKALFNPKMPTQRFLPYIDAVRKVEVDATNPKRFTVYAIGQYFLSADGLSNLIVMPEHIYDSEGLMKGFDLADLTNPETRTQMNDERLQQFADTYTSPKYSREVISGSGPYRLAEWVEDQRIVLVKKENWWGDALAEQYPLLEANPDTIILLPIPDMSAATAAVNDEIVDVAYEMDAKQFNEVRQSEFANKIFNFLTPARLVFFYETMNNQNPKLADKRVRRAIAHTLDIEGMIRDVYDGLAERQVGPFFSTQPYYDESLKPIEMDLEKARQLLAEAGWEDTNGNGIVDKVIDGQLTELELNYLYTPTSNFQDNLFKIQKSNAKKVGIEIKGEQVEGNTKAQRLRNGDYEMTGHGAGAAPVADDPKQLWHTDGAVPGGSNYSRFGNEASDKMIEDIRGAENEEDRFRAYKTFQKLVYDEQPVIFLFSPQEKIVVHQRFENIQSSRSAPGLSLQHLKLKDN